MTTRIDWPALKVLIVEDNHHLSALLRMVLKTAGIVNVGIATTGERAIEALWRSRADIALIDFYMDGMDGAALVRYLRRDPQSPCPDIPIILMTGDDSAKTARAALDAGADNVLVKPIAPSALFARLARTLLVPRMANAS